jgi:amino acid transporter
LVDAAIYPVLFATYVSKLLGWTLGIHTFEGKGFAHWSLSFVMIVAFTALNIRGAREVGRASVVFAFLIIGPFLLFSLIGLGRLIVHPVAIVPDFRLDTGALSSGLSLAMWNYLGWDALSTVAEEVDDPARAYPRAMIGGIGIVTLVYLLPVLTGLAFYPDVSKWVEGAWPDIARAVAGSWIAIPVSVAGIVSVIALFTASLLGSSRIPFVLAEGGYLPKPLVALHPRYGTPYRALILCGGVFAILAWGGFQELVTVNVILYASALVLELAALLILRVKEPDLPRPFRIRGGWPVLGLVFLLPTALAVLLVASSIQEEGWAKQGLTAAVLVSGPLIYAGVRLFKAPATG